MRYIVKSSNDHETFDTALEAVAAKIKKQTQGIAAKAYDARGNEIRNTELLDRATEEMEVLREYAPKT